MTPTPSWSLFWRKAKRRWILKYPDATSPDGWRQKTLGGDFTRAMKAEARTWSAEWLATSRARGDVPPPPRRGEGISLRDAHVRFLDLAGRDGAIAPSTLAGYRSDFHAHVLADERDRPAEERVADRGVAELGADFARWKLWYLALREHLDVYRARHVFSTLRVFFDEANVQRWWLGANPFRNKVLVRLLPPLPTKRERPPVTIPIAHAQALIAGEPIAASRRVRYAVAFTTSKRDGELSGLTWSALKLDAPIPHLEVDRARRAIRRKDEELGPLKTTTSSRTLPLHPAAIAALRWWRDDAQGVRYYLGREPTPADPVFPSERYGGRAEFARPRSADKIRADLEELELPTTGAKERSITMHSTRKSCLTYLEEVGVAERHRKMVAGHGVFDVTDRFYTADSELAVLAREVARIPLRWDDQGGGSGGRVVSGQVPSVVSHDTTASRDSTVCVGQDTSSRATAPVAQWIEQRFPKPREHGGADDGNSPDTVRHADTCFSGNAQKPASGLAQEPGSGRRGVAEACPGPAKALERAADGLAVQRATWDAFDVFDIVVGGGGRS